MKQLILLIVGLSLTIILHAQVSKTVNVTPGTLSSVFTGEESIAITSLTLTGTIDDRDIKTIQNGFPLLTELDLSGTTMVAAQMNGFTSEPNWWPGPTLSRNSTNYGGLGKPSLTSIILPSTLEAIGYCGFKGCSGLMSIIIPPTVKYIGEEAFQSCSSLTSVTIPPSVESIGSLAFSCCTGLTELPLPSNEISITRSLFTNCTGFTTLKIPTGIKFIGLESFIQCTSITTLTLPESVEYIDHHAFAICPNTSSIYSYNPIPPKMYTAFDNNVYTNGTLYVPLGSKALYEANHGAIDGWNEFKNIVEMPLFQLSTFKVSMAATAPAAANVELTTDSTWEAFSNQPWLTVSNSSGSGNQTITLTAEDNKLKSGRTAVVNVSIQGGYYQTIAIFQQTDYSNLVPVAKAGADQTVNEGAMVLLDGSASSDPEKDALTYLWTAPKGITLSSAINAKPTFTAPQVSADTKYTFSLVVNDGTTNSTADQVIVTVKKVNKAPVANAGADQSVNEGALVLLDGSASSDPDKDALTFLWTAPKGITLSSATNAKPTFTAPQVSVDTHYIFSLVVNDKTTNSTADQVVITNIYKMPEFKLSKTTANVEAAQGSTATVEITSNVPWTASSDQAWLTANPVSGTGNKTVAFIADANPAPATRTATVTLNAKGADPKIIVVTQQTMPTGVTETEQDIAQFKCYPNPFTQEMAIEIKNPKREKLTVDIYNMAGQRVKNLVTGSTSENLNLSWNGINEQGQQVTPGLYICKVNEQALEVVKGK